MHQATCRSTQGIFTKPLHQSQIYDAMVLALGSQPRYPSSRHSEKTRHEDLKLSASLRILLAEDNPVNQRVAQLMLEKLGQKADTVANGREALQAVQERPYDVALMDVLMPDMDGLEATRCIRERAPDDQQPRIIAMTVNALTGDRERCLQAGMNDYISKPVELEELARALKACRLPLLPETEGQGVAYEAGNATRGLPYNKARLESMAASIGAERTGRLLSLMINDSPRLLNGLRQALAASDPKGLQLYAHTLKSNTMMVGVGASALSQQFQELESLGRTEAWWKRQCCRGRTRCGIART